MGLLKQAILSHPEAVGFLIDGFPRELSQAPLFTQQVAPSSHITHTPSPLPPPPPDLRVHHGSDV